MTSPVTTPAWQRLTEIAAARQPGSGGCPSALPSLSAAGISADFSRQHIDANVAQALVALTQQMTLPTKREVLFNGGNANVTEGRPVLHTALRAAPDAKPVLVNGVDVMPAIHLQRERVRALSEAIRSGKRRGVSEQRFTDVVNIGIGGSSLGPALICQALAYTADGPRNHFVSNIDGADLQDVLRALNPATTLFTVTSKTFTTDETMTNARSAARWLAAALGDDAEVHQKHFVAITAKPEEARKQGYTAENVLEFWDWVGGRYSLWSTVGLPIALANGYAAFADLLAGAAAMDQHFLQAEPAQNLPVMLAMVGIWNRNFLNMSALAVLPYANRLGLLPRHLQQVEMESNGKSVDVAGNPLPYPTCPVLFGEVGTNGQHSFHQLLHQGTDRIPADIILVARDQSNLSGHHEKLLANALAQADALWFGKSTDALLQEMAQTIPDETRRAFLAAHRTHPGGRPVSLLTLAQIDAQHLGALIALYEHKTFVQGVIWNVDSFDQWGVELGKGIAKSLLPLVTDSTQPAPAHLQGTLTTLHALRQG